MRKITLLFIVLACAMLIAGCSNDGDTKSSSKGTKKSNKEAANTVSNLSQGDSGNSAVADNFINLINSYENAAYSTENGYYYVSMDNNETDNNDTLLSLMYVDYATKKEIYLCNKPDCTHKDENCSAVLPEELFGGEYYLFGNSTNLFLASTPADSDGSVSTMEIAEGYESMFSTISNIAPKITKINFDGTCREDIYTFESGVVLEEVFMQKDNYLYMITKKLSDENIGNNTTVTSAYDKKLVRLNLDSYQLEEVMDINLESDIIGCFGNKLVTSRLQFKRELTQEEILDDDTYFRELKDAQMYISLIDVDTKKESVAHVFSGANNYSYEVKNEYLYYSIEESNTINKLNLSTLEDTVINNTTSYRVMYVYDELLICNDWTENEVGYDGFFVNTQDGTITKLPSKKSSATPVDIVTANKDNFFVIYDYTEEDEYVAWVGVTQKIITDKSFGLVSKEDLLAGNGDYSDVDMIRMGD